MKRARDVALILNHRQFEDFAFEFYNSLSFYSLSILKRYYHPRKMSVDGEGSNESKPQTQPTSSQHLSHQDLNFSLNDILSNNHDVNDSSFQSIVQTLSNNNNGEHITPSYEHLPAELQDLFNTNETDDLLSVQGNNHSDASSVLQGDMAHIWHRPDMQPSQPFISSPSVPPVTPSPPISTASPSLSQTMVQQQTIPPELQQQQRKVNCLFFIFLTLTFF